jgi:hypothetical protein
MPSLPCSAPSGVMSAPPRSRGGEEQRPGAGQREQTIREQQRKQTIKEQQRKQSIKEEQRKQSIKEQQRKQTIKEQQRKQSIKEQQRKQSIKEQQRKQSIKEQQRKQSIKERARVRLATADPSGRTINQGRLLLERRGSRAPPRHVPPSPFAARRAGGRAGERGATWQASKDPASSPLHSLVSRTPSIHLNRVPLYAPFSFSHPYPPTRLPHSTSTLTL